MEWRQKTREEYLADIREALAAMPDGYPISEWAKREEWMRANVPPSLRRELAGSDQEGVPISEYVRRQHEEEAWWRDKLGPPPRSGPPPEVLPDPLPPKAPPEMLPDPLPPRAPPEMLPDPLPPAPPPEMLPDPLPPMKSAPPPELVPEPMPLGEHAPPPYEPPPWGVPEPMPLGEQAPDPYEPPPTGVPEPMPEGGPSSDAPAPWWRGWLGPAAVAIATVATIAVVATRDDAPGLPSSTPGGIQVCPTGGRARGVPCPDDVVDTVAVATPGEATTVPAAATVPVASTTVPVTAAPSVADYAGRWVLESGLVDPKGGDVLWYAEDMTNLVINPTTAEFVIDPDGTIRSGSYSASLTGQSGCGTENWSATFNEVDGFVGENGLGGINWSGTVDLGGTACFTAPDNNGNSANFWITGETMVMCDNPMPSPTECAPGWPKSIFRRT